MIGSFTLDASPTNGVWSVASGTAVIANTSQYNTTVSGDTCSAKAILQWTVSNGGCSSPSYVILKNDAPPVVANAGPEQFNCTNSIFMVTGNNPAPGTGLWSIVSGTGTIVIPTQATMQINGVPVNDSINDTTVVA